MKKEFIIALSVLAGFAIAAPALALSPLPGQNVTEEENARLQGLPTGTSTPRKNDTVKLEARLERAKEKAAQELERRTAALQRLEERIAAMKRVSATFKTDLDTTVAAEIAKLEALAAKIAASTNAEEIKTDVQSITRSYRIFALVMPKAAIAAAADKMVNMSATLSEIGAKLKVRIDEASAKGADVSELNTALTDLAAKITSANAHAQAAVNGTAALTPDEGDKAKQEANKAALQKAKDELKAGQADIQAGRALVQKILDGLKTHKATSTPATVERQPNVQV